jgi:ATP-grasp domain
MNAIPDAILVFQRAAPDYTPLEDYLGNSAPQAVVLCPAEHAPKYVSPREVIGFENYPYSPQVEETAVRLCDRYRFRAVIAISEFDLERAGRLRDLLHLEGQNEKSATAFRDKYVMKRILSEAGVRCARFMEFDQEAPMRHVVAALGFPLVIKPRNSVGSRGVEIIHNADELERWATRSSDRSNLMAEEYVDLPMYHVDGLFHRGDVIALSASRYIGTCLDFRKGWPLGGIQIKSNTPLFDRIERHTRHVLKVLPTPDFTPFHLEIFVDGANGKDPTILFSEIASRVGGGNVEDTMELKHGIVFSRAWIRHQLDGDVAELRDCKTVDSLFGWILFTLIPGTVKHIPEGCNHPNVLKYKAKKKKGDVIDNAHSSVDCMAFAVISGDTEQELAKTFEEVTSWFYAAFQTE